MATTTSAEPFGRAGAVDRFPNLRLRRPTAGLLLLPWERPLESWSTGEARFRELPIGPSRHLVRFVEMDGTIYALKELPLRVGLAEYDVLRHLEQLEFASVAPVGVAEAPERDTCVLLTEYLRHSLQYRRLLMRLRHGASPYRDRLLDAMAWLLVDLHRNGVYWGDCSLENTLFRRDGDRIQAFLVDAETSEIHPTLSDGQRAADLEILVENVAFGLADLAAFLGLGGEADDAIAAAEGVRARYEALWDELHAEPEYELYGRHAVTARVRRLNDLGFAVDEVELSPSAQGGRLRLRVVVTNRRFHAHQLERMTGIVALEGQARLLLNDLREYRTWLAWREARAISPAAGAAGWLRDVLEPRIAELAPAIGPLRDPLQAYCDVLEHKWLLSERAGADVGLDDAIRSYLEVGAPAPEVADAVSVAVMSPEDAETGGSPAGP